MRILVVGLVKNPQLARVKEEGKKRGHEVDGCYVSDLVIEASIDQFKPSLQGKILEDYNVIYLWALGKKSWEWYVACSYLHENYQTVVVNYKTIDPSYKLFSTAVSTYYKLHKEGILFPKSTLIFSPKSVDEAIKSYKMPVIVKASRGRQGKSVFKTSSVAEIKKITKEMGEEKKAAIIREFIPNDGDVRVFTVGFKAIGAMKRIPTDPGEFRSNISVGGRGENYELDKSPEVRKIAERMSEITATEIAGVDIMLHKVTGKPYVLEVNPGPQFTGFEKYTGVNAAEEIVKYFEKLYKGRDGKS
jgi:RimK family alpha-L-glutamate ligase